MQRKNICLILGELPKILPKKEESAPMKLPCTISRTVDGRWLARHVGAQFGPIEITAMERESALTKLREELQYRIELCPCSGVSGDTVALVVDDS